MRYAVLIQQDSTRYVATVPDLPGCEAVGKSLYEVKQAIGAAIQLYIAAMRAKGEAPPEPKQYWLEYAMGN